MTVVTVCRHSPQGESHTKGAGSRSPAREGGRHGGGARSIAQQNRFAGVIGPRKPGTHRRQGGLADMFLLAPEADRRAVEELVEAVGLRPVYLGGGKHEVVDGVLRLRFELVMDQNTAVTSHSRCWTSRRLAGRGWPDVARGARPVARGPGAARLRRCCARSPARIPRLPHPPGGVSPSGRRPSSSRPGNRAGRS